MRLFALLLAALLCIFEIIVLDTKWLLPLPLGSFLNPQQGIWQNAEPYDEGFNTALRFPGLKDKTEVYFDERLVPHVVAQEETDAYFVQGYLHARFRLWQMEFQTHAAAGRISELIGPAAIQYDRAKRRLGMVYAAEKMLKEIEGNTITKSICDAYTAGVNTYIASLRKSELPLEYKILGYQPERWNNLKTALFIKQMTDNLAGTSDDLEMTAARSFFSDAELELLFPQIPDSLDPIIPAGTFFNSPAAPAVKPVFADSLYLRITDSTSIQPAFKPNPANGSNNWVVSGARTKNGYPILCNDPHLDLSLPAVWYEMQLSVPGMNAYGVSFPGIPGIVIGFNDSIAFGFTNAGRDVMDYYSIRFRDTDKREYWFDSAWQASSLRIETIKVKGRPDVYDTVAYTVFGPVTYDASFTNGLHPGRALALRWVAHDPSNELLFYYQLTRAHNYSEFEKILPGFTCPAQNIAFASKSGDIALWQQGRFPNRWERQGVYVMPGDDSTYSWQQFIPDQENPHLLNPERGFLSSANQRPVDSSYPYFIPGSYDMYRGAMINRRLEAMDRVTPGDMMRLQNDNFNLFAKQAVPFLIPFVNGKSLNNLEMKYLDTLRQWNFGSDPGATAPTVFEIWYDSLQHAVWDDELASAKINGMIPEERTLLEALKKDSFFKFVDNIHTVTKETLFHIATASFVKATRTLRQLQREDRLEWGKYKSTTVYHLLREGLLPFARTQLPVGGGRHIINAATHDHGPSWRMVVELGPVTQAWVVYPGGQSGNPGSRYYDDFVNQWATGNYYKAWVLDPQNIQGQRVKWTMQFSAN